MQRRHFCKNLMLGWGLGSMPSILAASENHQDTVDPSMDPELARRMQEKIDQYNRDFDDDVYLSGARLE